jgi:uncharacterized repeat protein (TIGR03847 family)
VTAFDEPQVFTTGAVGPPGQRVFYLQARDGDLTVTVRCEKQQVSALADYFDGLLDDLSPAPYGLSSSDLALVEPVEAIWTVGPIGVAYDEPDDRIIVVLEELVLSDDGELVEDEDDLEPSGATVKVRLSRAQVSSFVRHSRELVASGRPPCRFCSLPLDPVGHACPKMN